MFYFSTPLNVSFAHTKGDKRTLNCESLIIIIILLTYIRYICKLHSSSNKQRDTERTYIFSQHKRPLSTPKQNCKMQFFLLSNTSMFTFSLFPSLFLSLFISQLCSFRTKTHTNMRTPTRTRTHTHTNTHVAVLLALTLSPIWNSHSAMASDSNESASTNARLTDFVAMLLLLLVLEIDGNDKWRQRDVATTSTHRQLTRQSHSTAAQQAAQAWNIKRGSFAVAVTDAALLSTFASSQIHAYVHTNTRAWWTSRTRVYVCVCVQWGFFWWVFRCGKFHK